MEWFEAAVDAIAGGDVDALQALLHAHPALIRARSARPHGATLLHYVGANGVEQERQRTPKNIAEITEILLQAGADVDAAANMYGGGCTALGLAATSVHPEKAGVQEELLEALLRHGAKMDSLVGACLANGRRKSAEYLASRGASLDFVEHAGLGNVDAVRSLAATASRDQLEQGFLYACQYGRDEVVAFLLEQGVDIATAGGDGQTGLHWAVTGGQLSTVKLLLLGGAPLEVKNRYGGTVYGQALWSAEHGGDADVYAAILETLNEAGASAR